VTDGHHAEPLASATELLPKMCCDGIKTFHKMIILHISCMPSLHYYLGKWQYCLESFENIPDLSKFWKLFVWDGF